SEYPIRAALHERVSETLEPLGGPLRRARPERWPEALVGALVEVEAGQELVVEALRRCGDGAAGVGQRCIGRQPARRDLDSEALEPCGRNKVEQRGRGEEIEWTIEGEFEVAREIERRGRDGDVRRMFGGEYPRQKTETIIHQPPVLTRRKMGSHRSQRRAGATGGSDGRERGLSKERRGGGVAPVPVP